MSGLFPLFLYRTIVNNARQLITKTHTNIAITKLNSFFSNFVFRNKSFYETIHTSTSISRIYGFKMKQSLANSPFCFIVHLSISQRGHSYYNDHRTSFLNSIKGCQLREMKRLHYDNKVNFSSGFSALPAEAFFP